MGVFRDVEGVSVLVQLLRPASRGRPTLAFGVAGVVGAGAVLLRGQWLQRTFIFNGIFDSSCRLITKTTTAPLCSEPFSPSEIKPRLRKPALDCGAGRSDE